MVETPIGTVIVFRDQTAFSSNSGYLRRHDVNGADGPPALRSGVVAFLFSDIEGSTALLHRLGHEYAQPLGVVQGAALGLSRTPWWGSVGERR
jgi:hypothetical protein